MTSIDPTSTAVAMFVEDHPDLRSEAWNRCIPIHITHQWSGIEAPPTRHAEARVSWNHQGLTVRFVCEQNEPLVVSDNPVTSEKSVGLWDRDVCEIFVAPDPSNINHYFEFEAAPTGEWIDLALHITPTARETEWDYRSGMTTQHSVELHRIFLSITIPWSDRIPKPAVGDEWRVNLFRCVGPDEATRYLAWRPTRTPEPNYHVPEVFGVLRFE
jgi:hypothetical protein